MQNLRFRGISCLQFTKRDPKYPGIYILIQFEEEKNTSLKE